MRFSVGQNVILNRTMIGTTFSKGFHARIIDIEVNRADGVRYRIQDDAGFTTWTWEEYLDADNGTLTSTLSNGGHHDRPL
jgi:hypothetical protein